LTWAALLAHWTQFARSAVAFPADRTGERWKASVAPAIGLQAVAFALGEVDHLEPAERALSIDRAETLIRKFATELHEAWRGEPLHQGLEELVSEARRALAESRGRGIEWRVTVDRWLAPDLGSRVDALLEAGWTGQVFLAPRGITLFRGSPAAFFSPDCGLAPPEGCETVRVPGLRQVYRQVDPATGRATRDVIAPLSRLTAGTPLLQFYGGMGFGPCGTPMLMAGGADMARGGADLPVVESPEEQIEE
jgi:hypothetical protein